MRKKPEMTFLEEKELAKSHRWTDQLWNDDEWQKI